MRSTMKFSMNPEITTPPPHIIQSLHSADVSHNKTNLEVLCLSSINTHGNNVASNAPSTLKQLFSHLPKSLQRLCGNIELPPDDGVALSKHLLTSNKPLYGAADASLKDGNTSHAWVLSTGNIEDISNPLLHISGSGPVDGHPHDMSSSRGELQGQAALVTIANMFMDKHSIPNPSLHVTGDNQGIMNRCWPQPS